MKELTKSELQYLIHKIKPLIERAESSKELYTLNSNLFWARSDKENDPDSLEYQDLKYYLTRKDKFKQEQKKLALIQGKLKKLAST